jgi:hypothetical protein
VPFWNVIPGTPTVFHKMSSFFQIFRSDFEILCVLYKERSCWFYSNVDVVGGVIGVGSVSTTYSKPDMGLLVQFVYEIILTFIE